MKTYKTIQGDTWDLIAHKMYGTEMVMTKLMEANPNIMSIAIFNAGTTISLPEIDTTVKSRNKPPWVK